MVSGPILLYSVATSPFQRLLHPSLDQFKNNIKTEHNGVGGGGGSTGVKITLKKNRGRIIKLNNVFLKQ